METILKHITCGHTNHTYSKYLEFNFSKEDKILESVKVKASELTNTLNPKDPGGKEFPFHFDSRIFAQCRTRFVNSWFPGPVQV